MFRLLKGLAYVTVIGLLGTIAIVFSKQERGHIVEHPDELGFWWEAEADNDSENPDGS